MQESLVSRLVCPECRSGLTLESPRRSASGEIEAGTLVCASCGRSHPILQGIPRLLAAGGNEGSRHAASRFGWQWLRCKDDGGLNFWASESLFLEYVSPVSADFFKGKTVLDAGCGMGRFTRHALGLGAEAVYAVDLSESVERVHLQCEGAPPNLHPVQADFQDLPLAVGFDYIFSLGVLHHLQEPPRGFAALAKRLKPGGHISIWVYGRENNDWIVGLVDPVRKNLTSRLPIPVVYALSYGLALLMYPTIGHIGRFSSFYNEYVVNMLDRLTFRELAGVVLDHLQTPTTFYISRGEVERWFRENDLELLSITPRNANSWRALGRRR